MANKWIDLIEPPNMNANFPPIDEDFALTTIVLSALKGMTDGAVHFTVHGKGISSHEEIFNLLLNADKNGKVILKYAPTSKIGVRGVFAWDHGVVSMNRYHRGDEWLQISVASFNEDFVNKIKDICDKHLTSDGTRGQVFTVINTLDGPGISEVGFAGVELQESNYDPSIIEQFRHITEDLKSSSPCGRLIIVNGEPGTGKTYFIRAILNSVPKATFIVVPSHLLAQLADPSFIQVLIDSKADSNGGPTVLIAEDADSCLVNRQADNINAISSLLNLGDGILGSILDIRIIATTNAEVLDLDTAILRPGRLCTHVNIGKLSPEQASSVFERLTGKREELPSLTLAEIYQRKSRQSNSVGSKKKVGFLK